MSCCGQNTTGSGVAPTADTVKRVNYVKGMLLGVDDFVQEQAWGIARRHELARELLGYGTARGLQVGVDADSPGPRVRVSPGVAWMPSGTPVCVNAEQCCDINAWLRANQDKVRARLSGDPSPLTVHVVLAYAALPTDKMPIPGEPCRSEESLTADSRIADCFRLELRLDAPDQIEEDAIRDFADWLAQVPVDPGSPPMSEQDYLEQLRQAAHAWLTPGSPHVGDFMHGSPPAGLGTTDALMRAALRLWVTELRPIWRARYGCGPNAVLPGGTHDAVLLASLALTVYPGTMEAAAKVDVLEEARPVLLSLRMVQELITQNPAPEPGDTVVPASAFGLPATAGSDTAYARADHSHGTPVLPDLAGEVIGPIGATVVDKLLGHGFGTPPSTGDTLALDAAGQWQRGHLPRPADTVVGAAVFGMPASAGAATTLGYARADHSHGTPALVGDVEAVSDELARRPGQRVRVTGLHDVPLAGVEPKIGQVLGYEKQPDGGAAWTPRDLPVPVQPGSVVAQQQFGAAASDGVDHAHFARADHTHGTPPIGGDATAISDTSGQRLRITGLQGRAVRDTEPRPGQVLSYDGRAWSPSDPGSGGGPAPGTTPPPGLNFGVGGVVGSGSAYALSNHTHSLPALPDLGGDLRGAIGGAGIVALQGVPVDAARPSSGAVLTFDGRSWVPGAAAGGGLVEAVAAGIVELDLTGRAPLARFASVSGPGQVSSGAVTNGRQVTLDLELAVPDADGPRRGFALELTPMWNEKGPILAYVAGIKVLDKSNVAVSIVIFSQDLVPDRYRVHFELNRYVPFAGN